MRFDRCKKLFSKFEHLKELKVLICGVGGVGGYALDCLYRSGVINITIVDFDSFDITNQNRQIGSRYVGEKKVKVLSKLYPGITPIDMKLTPENIENLNLKKYVVEEYIQYLLNHKMMDKLYLNNKILYYPTLLGKKFIEAYDKEY